MENTNFPDGTVSSNAVYGTNKNKVNRYCTRVATEFTSRPKRGIWRKCHENQMSIGFTL